MQNKKLIVALSAALAFAGVAMFAQAQQTAPASDTTTAPAPTASTPASTPAAPTPADRIAALKANLVQSAQNLRTYQWTETQVVNLKGEDKSSTQKTCYYGADGKVVKTAVAPPAEGKGKPGLRGKIVENKKEEISAYMQSAIALVKSYVPPDPAKLQAAKDAGKVSMTVLDPGKRARIDIKDYEKPGDNLGVEIDMTTNQILGLNVASYLADAKDAVTLDVKMAALPDGTGYPATIVLDGKAEKIKVTVSNSGYVKKTS